MFLSDLWMNSNKIENLFWRPFRVSSSTMIKGVKFSLDTKNTLQVSQKYLLNKVKLINFLGGLIKLGKKIRC